MSVNLCKVLFLGCLYLKNVPVSIPKEEQRSSILYFTDCGRCRFLYSTISDKIAMVRMAIEEKENFPDWINVYEHFVIDAYYLDRHMNRVHNKCKIRKIDRGDMWNIGKISCVENYPDSIFTPIISYNLFDLQQ